MHTPLSLSSLRHLRTAGRETVFLLATFALFACLSCQEGRAQQATWPSYGGNVQHTALSSIASQPLQVIHWHMPVDPANLNTSGDLYIHYGSPLITQKNTVVVTVRTNAQNNYQVEGHGGYSGELKWVQPTDYIMPPYDWIPSCGSALAPDNSLYTPGAGGTLWHISNVDRSSVYATRVAFYGLSTYTANSAKFNQTVFVDTPITCDKAGNVYFGIEVTGANPSNLQGGLVRIGANGVATWVAASTAAGDGSVSKVAQNCTPALSNDGSLVYVAVNGGGPGYLLALDSTTLATRGKAQLIDVVSGQNANVIDDGTATPMVGPDDDVYYGVLEIPWFSNNDRGWMLHFDKLLTTTKTPGAFGWDDTASVVPASAVPSYTGSSSYLILTKYNKYADFGKMNGLNEVAVLDPNATMTDSFSGATVMNEVITVVGVTFNTELNVGVREWCINSAAVDPLTKSALINSEDGTLYRWDFPSNSLTQKVALTPGRGEAYTPTLVGPDGTVYAINDATLFAVGSNTPNLNGAGTFYAYSLQNHGNQRWQQVKLTNTSGCLLTGPISLVLDNLTPGVTLVNATGQTANAAPLGSPYITVLTGNANPGDSVTITLKFQTPAGNTPVSYTPRVLGGPGAP